MAYFAGPRNTGVLTFLKNQRQNHPANSHMSVHPKFKLIAIYAEIKKVNLIRNCIVKYKYAICEG